MSAIAVSDLVYRYPKADHDTLRGLALGVDRGEIVGLLGPSGAGKSTTQKILTGLLAGFAGHVGVLGRDVTAWGRDLYDHIGVGFELPVSFGHLDLVENLEYFAALQHGRTRAPLDLLEAVGLASDARIRASAMSKGMGIRLNVARALLHEPELVFLDEPTSGLDPVSVDRMEALLRDEKARGCTVVVTTHDMAFAQRVCDRVAFVIDGQIAAEGVPDELRRRYGRRQVDVTWSGGSASFPLEGIADNAAFLDALRDHDVLGVHSQETDLGRLFTRLTGRSLS